MRLAQLVKNLPAMQETWVRSLGQEDPLEKGMATQSSILAWRIPWTEDSPWGCKVSDTTEWLTLTFQNRSRINFFFIILTLVGWHHQLNGHEFEQAPGDGEGQWSLVCCSPWGHKESDTTEQLNNNNKSLINLYSYCSISDDLPSHPFCLCLSLLFLYLLLLSFCSV